MGIPNENNDYPISRKYPETEEHLKYWDSENEEQSIQYWTALREDISKLEKDIEVVGKVRDGLLSVEDLDREFVTTIMDDWVIDTGDRWMEDLLETLEKHKEEEEEV